MYYWYEGNEKDDSVIKTFDEEELSNLNVNLPDDPDANTEEEIPQDEEVNTDETPTEESKKYDVPKTTGVEFKKEECTSMYPGLPGSNSIVVANNPAEDICIVIHGMDDDQFYVTTPVNSTCFESYRDAKAMAIREAVRLHKKFLESNISVTSKTFLEIYESCKNTEGIQMIYKENQVKAVYPKSRKCVIVSYDTRSSEYVIESKTRNDIIVNRVSSRYMESVGKDHLIRSILLGGN